MQRVMQKETLSDDVRGMLLAELKQQGGISEKTPSKNGLCPCGSGKKYKRCCGKK
ncbi:MAG: SEC-C domain-containing protein [Oscillospiraceae bacterium]|nr:SEC-C domain-containing protein [Oscillospiraceae bacterium]